MKIPITNRKRALIVVDLQPAFIKDHNSYIVPRVRKLIENVPYDAYVEAVFSAEEGSLWDVQQQWYAPKNEQTHTVDEVNGVLQPKNPLHVHKHGRSVFEGNQDVVGYLQKKAIEEVHLVGIETNDCVMATAFGSFDKGFAVYILEECCESATEGRHQMGLDILRIQGMTNNHCLADTEEMDI